MCGGESEWRIADGRYFSLFLLELCAFPGYCCGPLSMFGHSLCLPSCCLFLQVGLRLLRDGTVPSRIGLEDEAVAVGCK